MFKSLRFYGVDVGRRKFSHTVECRDHSSDRTVCKPKREAYLTASKTGLDQVQMTRSIYRCVGADLLTLNL